MLLYLAYDPNLLVEYKHAVFIKSHGCQLLGHVLCVTSSSKLNIYFWLRMDQSMCVLAAPYLRNLSFNYTFGWRHVNMGAFVNYMVVLSFLINSVVCAVALRFVVSRAKKCLDFGSTMYIIHMFWCWAYKSFPTGYVWWAVMATCLAITVLLGEYLCVQLEMADIPLAGAKQLPLPAHAQRSFRTPTVHIIDWPLWTVRQ